MLWLYFVRDFYRTANGSSSSRHHYQPAEPQVRFIAAALTVTTVFRNIERITALPPAEIITQSASLVAPKVKKKKPAPAAAKQTPAPAPIAAPAVKESPLAHYLQRLSIDGDHAFGIWDEDVGFSMFSANFERVTGLSSGECAGHDWIYTVHNQQQYAVNEALINAQAGQDGLCLVQARSSANENEWRWLLIDVKAPSKRQPGIMVMFRDLTEQKALEEALRQTESALAMSERGRAAFLSSMSHELRTPLNAIMGFSEMMKSGVFGNLDNPTYSEYAKHIHDSGTHLLGKINDLLEIASMDAGGLVLEEEDFEVADLLGEVIEMHSHAAFTRRQQLVLDCPKEVEIAADRAKILCAVSHLLTNALRHSKDGEKITLSVRVQADDGVIISVRDTGEGISQAQLEIIRTALSSNDSYYNIECGGIGLGLSLAKELSQRHGGRIMIDSMRHRGTVVSVILPTDRILRGLPQKKRSTHLELV